MTRDDPLRGFLGRMLTDRLGVRRHDDRFRVFRLNGSNEVYGYEEASSGTKLVCKFYGATGGTDPGAAEARAEHEYHGLRTLRRHGLVGSPHHVVRPLGIEPQLNAVLAVEYYRGEPLSRAISRSARDGDDDHLYGRLTSLAYFLASQHNRTATEESVDFDVECRYFTRLVSRLERRGRISAGDAAELGALRDRWRERPAMWQDRQVWLHGDATPANFLFGGGIDVGAIDLERMKRGDRVFDVGRVTGELQHAYQQVGSRHRAEPFIGHFLWEYCGHFPDRRSAFEAICARNPFYQGLNLLRIARNGYLTPDYARRLVRQAKRVLGTRPGRWER